MGAWDSEKVYFNAAGFFDDVIREISHARTTVEVETYIFELDGLGGRLVGELRRAAERGVAVRILVDGIGSMRTAGDLAGRFIGTTAVVRVYHPVFFGGVVSSSRTLNRRNHRKAWVFDSRTAYVGSMNVAQNDWVDYGVRVEGRWVALLGHAFEKSWAVSSRWRQLARPIALRRWVPYQKGGWIRLNDTLLRRRRNYKLLLGQIREAREKVWLASPYFVPRLGIVRALCGAARRGVDVRVMVPRRSDVFFMPWVASTYFMGLLGAGVKIFKYLPRFHHAKAQVIDDWASIGSTNLNHRSLYHDLEVDVVVTLPENRRMLETELGRAFAMSEAVTPQAIRETPWFKSAASRLFLLFKSWL